MAKSNRLRTARAVALALCACLLLVLVGSALFLAVHSHHHCTDATCQICYHLHQAQQTLKRLLCGGFGAALALLAVAAPAMLALCAAQGLAAATPVQTRVRLNN